MVGFVLEEMKREACFLDALNALQAQTHIDIGTKDSPFKQRQAVCFMMARINPAR